jgi:hypothetical protein
MAKTPALWLRTALAAVLAVVCAVLKRSGTAADPYEIDAIVSLTGGGSFVGHDFAPNDISVAAQITRVKSTPAQLLVAFAKVGAPLPGFPHQVAWDPAMIIVSALRKLGPDATAAQVHDYLENLRGWIGINGAYDFVAVPQRGLGLGSVVITRWNAGNERWEAVSKGGGTVVGS